MTPNAQQSHKKEIKSEPLIEKARIAGTEKLDNSDVTFYAIK